jgi:lipid-A-disaccharide synthase
MGSSQPVPAEFAPPSHGAVDLLIIAGEHSGDQQAARMLRGVMERRPDLKVAALGGTDLRKAGAQLLFDLTGSSVVGLAEVLRNYGFFRRIFELTKRWIDVHRPSVVCLVDYPGFNLRLASVLFSEGISRKGGGGVSVIYYISPQIWAWKAGRRFKMARHLDALSVIFPFEVACYADTDLPVRFVGHPFMADDHIPSLAYDPDGSVLLLPGSRRTAVSRIAPILLDAYARYRHDGGLREAVIITPDSELRGRVEQLLSQKSGIGDHVKLVPKEQLVSAAAVLTSSGTMSLACALAGIPGAITYRANPITYFIGVRLVRVPYLGIANLILESPIYPEFLQGAARPGPLAAEIKAALDDDERTERTRVAAAQLRKTLHSPDTGTAADWMIDCLEARF